MTLKEALFQGRGLKALDGAVLLNAGELAERAERCEAQCRDLAAKIATKRAEREGREAMMPTLIAARDAGGEDAEQAARDVVSCEQACISCHAVEAALAEKIENTRRLSQRIKERRIDDPDPVAYIARQLAERVAAEVRMQIEEHLRAELPALLPSVADDLAVAMLPIEDGAEVACENGLVLARVSWLLGA